MDKFYQACYTRVGGADRNSGWQLTNTSPDTPAKLLNAFEQRQKGNEPVGRETPRDVNREFLCALDISCEQDTVSYTRIQYGVPCHGREGSYSHGYLFPNAYEFLKDPNRLLALADDNFCFHGSRPEPTEALELYLERTRQVPEQLHYGEGWTVERAMKRAGMKKSAYREFVCCLYGSWAKSAKTTIFVRTDGSDEMAGAIVYLAYAALPYSMRPKLAASTFPDAKNATLVLTHEQPDGCRYFDPVTGAHNVLTANQRKRWEKMPFVTMLFEEEGAQFDALEQQLGEMGDRYSQDVNTLQMACQMGLESADADPLDQLYDFLNIPQEFNEMMEDKAARKLEEVCRIVEQTNVAMSDDMERMLDQRMESARSRFFRDMVYRFKSARLAWMDLQEGCRYLRDNPAFEILRKNLQGTEKGLLMLTEYYRQQIDSVIDSPDCTYENLVQCAGQFCDLSDMGDLWNMVLLTAQKIASDRCRAAMLGMRTGAEANAEHTALYLALDEYAEFSRRIQNLEKIDRETYADVKERIGKELAAVTAEWLREYDKQFRRSFDPKRMEEYRQFYTKDFSHEKFVRAGDLRYSAMLLGIYLAAPGGQLDKLMNFTDNGCVFEVMTHDGAGVRRRTLLKPASEDEKMLIERSLYSYWVESPAVKTNEWMWPVITEYNRDPRQKNLRKFQETDTRSFEFWEKAARHQNVKNMIWLMLEKKAVLILAEGILERSLGVNTWYWTDEKLSAAIGYCDDCIRDGKNEAKEIRSVLQAEVNVRAEMQKESAKKPKQPKPQKQEKSSKKSEKAAKTPAQPVIRDNQPGTANKFTEDAPASRSGSQSAYSNGYTNVSASRPQPGNDENIDALMGIMGTTQNRPAPQEETYYYSENVPNPLLNPEETDKPAKRNLFDIFVNKKRRS